MKRKIIAFLNSQREQEKDNIPNNIKAPKKKSNKKIYIIIGAIFIIGFIVNQNTNTNPTPTNQTQTIQNQPIVNPIIKETEDERRQALEEKIKQEENANSTTDIDSRLPEVNFDKKVDDSPENATNEIKDEPKEENNSNDFLAREVASLLKDAKFYMNAKPNSISLFINNIHTNVGDYVLSNKKFIISEMDMVCVDNEMPSLNVKIASSENNSVIHVVKVPLTNNKKVILGFDSISIVDKFNSIENIFIEGEQIFKGFKLLNITENNNNLKFNFDCNGKKFSITGKELDEIK